MAVPGHDRTCRQAAWDHYSNTRASAWRARAGLFCRQRRRQEQWADVSGRVRG